MTHFPVDAPKGKVIKTFELLGSKADLLTLIKRMVQLYPDLTGLIETAQQTTLS